MARIRSIHPGQWTDEEFVSLSFAARLLAIGLRNEADDHGVFEWKPITIKMKLFAADNVDVSALLDELVDARQIQRFEVDGKAYGAIRAFRRWQRPEKPKATFPLPRGLRAYIGLVDEGASEEPELPSDPGRDDDASATGRRIPPQRKEEGGKGKNGVGGGARATDRLPFDDATEAVIAAAGADPSKQAGWMTCAAHVSKWLERGCDLDLDVVPAIRAVMVGRQSQGPPHGPAYFDRAVIEAMERRLRPLPDPEILPPTGGRPDARSARATQAADRRSRGESALADYVRRGGGPGG
ncbi:hypothetical protein STAQ_27850 [Allostella sp. ATCC 35155]|nr:hypothetical protein STAQ_27850 [Stella sp. ATCC 35155]